MRNLTTIHTKAYQALTAWLRHQRDAKGITTQELADRLNVERSIISKIETNVRRLDVAEYVDLCNAIDADPYEGIKLLIESKN
jgi:transcriptional regulator with XRE-family HTH domain